MGEGQRKLKLNAKNRLRQLVAALLFTVMSVPFGYISVPFAKADPPAASSPKFVMTLNTTTPSVTTDYILKWKNGTDEVKFVHQMGTYFSDKGLELSNPRVWRLVDPDRLPVGNIFAITVETPQGNTVVKYLARAIQDDAFNDCAGVAGWRNRNVYTVLNSLTGGIDEQPHLGKTFEPNYDFYQLRNVTDIETLYNNLMSVDGAGNRTNPNRQEFFLATAEEIGCTMNWGFFGKAANAFNKDLLQKILSQVNSTDNVAVEDQTGLSHKPLQANINGNDPNSCASNHIKPYTQDLDKAKIKLAALKAQLKQKNSTDTGVSDDNYNGFYNILDQQIPDSITDLSTVTALVSAGKDEQDYENLYGPVDQNPGYPTVRITADQLNHYNDLYLDMEKYMHLDEGDPNSHFTVVAGCVAGLLTFEAATGSFGNLIGGTAAAPPAGSFVGSARFIRSAGGSMPVGPAATVVRNEIRGVKLWGPTTGWKLASMSGGSCAAGSAVGVWGARQVLNHARSDDIVVGIKRFVRVGFANAYIQANTRYNLCLKGKGDKYAFVNSVVAEAAQSDTNQAGDGIAANNLKDTCLCDDKYKAGWTNKFSMVASVRASLCTVLCDIVEFANYRLTLAIGTLKQVIGLRQAGE